jgi:RNA polymerase sigma factor (sigma-70 family)
VNPVGMRPPTARSAPGSAPREGLSEDAETTRLYEAYSDQLLGFCTRRLGSRTEAEDAVQLTFLYAFRALQRGVVPEAESAWLHAIAANVCRWQLRTRSRRGPLATDLDLDQFAAEAPADGDQRGLCRDLRETLRALPATQRRALVLREWHGLPSHEVAAALGMSTSATYALLTRARQSFARAFEAAREAVPGIQLAALLPELRAQLKALFGTASTKTATVATVAAVGVGGVAVERSLEADGSRSRDPVGAAVSPASTSDAVAVSAGEPAPTASAGGALAPAGRSAPTAGQPGGRVEPGEGPSVGVVVPPRRPDADPPSTPSPGGDQPSPSPSPTTPTSEPSPEPLPSVPVDVPPLPEVEPPEGELPPVDLPPVDPPPVDLPPVDLSPAGLPTVDVPPIDLPPVDVPPIDLPDLPGPL